MIYLFAIWACLWVGCCVSYIVYRADETKEGFELRQAILFWPWLIYKIIRGK